MRWTSNCQARWPLTAQSACGLCALAPGAPLWKILEAGEWRSPAFLKYLDFHKLETGLVMQAHLEESDEDELA